MGSITTAMAEGFNAGLPNRAQELSLPVRCIIRTDSPPYLPTIYNNDFQIFQNRCSRESKERRSKVKPIRRNLQIVSAGIVVLVILAAVPVFAHHAFASEFDANKPVKFRGTVTKMEWINPHAWIHISVKKPDGKVEEWMIEAGTPNT